MKVYISGPMSGVAEKNKPAFLKAQADLEARGYLVVSPLSVDGKLSKNGEDVIWKDAMKEDIRLLLDCDGIYCLPDWEFSRGAKLENEIAMALGLKRVY